MKKPRFTNKSLDCFGNRRSQELALNPLVRIMPRVLIPRRDAPRWIDPLDSKALETKLCERAWTPTRATVFLLQACEHWIREHISWRNSSYPNEILNAIEKQKLRHAIPPKVGEVSLAPSPNAQIRLVARST